MNTAIILAGGTGTRMGIDRPKQFLMVQGGRHGYPYGYRQTQAVPNGTG